MHSQRPEPDGAVIDAHHHVWDPTTRDHSWLSDPALAPIRRAFAVADLAPDAAAAGVRATVLVQVLADVTETAEFLALAEKEALIAGVVGWVDLAAPDVADTIAALRAGPGGDALVGIRHLVQGEADPAWLTRPDVVRGLRAVASAGLTYDLLTRQHQLPAAIEVAHALPELTFVLDHLSKPPVAAGELEPWATRLHALAAAPNVLAKLSGLVSEAESPQWTVADLWPYTEIAVDAFGPDRLMFGSDWPVCLPAASYAQVVTAARALTAELSETEQAAVFAGTARRAYRLTTRINTAPSARG
jgi:L-fuconolactonase